jgi:beta-lactamase superfamily II metal-dependent hydrolase
MATKKPVALVRMYNVGFGDSFLLQLPSPQGGVLKVLIDCGTIASASMSMKDVVGTIIDDVTDDDGVARIDVIVCTHRHADHVSGFADARWKDVEVQEVWFPWTEHPTDPQAKQIRETQSRLALALHQSWSALAAGNPDQARYIDVALNALSNQGAMDMLHRGIRSKPARKFLSAASADGTVFESDALPGVTVHVLGPSKDEAVIRDMNPPAGKTYLKRVAADGTIDSPFEPFGAEWRIAHDRFRWSDLAVSSRDDEIMRRSAEDADPAITVALDKAVNGTSLVLVFEIGDAVLLFPGDAQWGTWQQILESEVSRDLLSRVNFFKVGHHGSHNATPKAFVKELFQSNCCTMMSTREGKWDSIPRVPLLTALNKKTNAFARSDDAEEEAVKPFLVRSSSHTDAEIPIS